MAHSGVTFHLHDPISCAARVVKQQYATVSFTDDCGVTATIFTTPERAEAIAAAFAVAQGVMG